MKLFRHLSLVITIITLSITPIIDTNTTTPIEISSDFGTLESNLSPDYD